MKYTEIYHSCHDHKLILKKLQVPYICYGCNQRGFSPCYECEYEECNFHLHQDCARPEFPLFHKFFEECEFKFHETSPGGEERYCDACGKQTRGFMYQCKCDQYDLHPCCAKLPHMIYPNGGAKMYLREKASSRCLKCQKKEVSSQVKGWCYASSCGKYCYHVACVKAIVVEDWKTNNFLQNGENINNEASSLALQTIAPSREVARPIEEGSTSIGRKAMKFVKKAALILGAIMSAIFGEPITLFVVLAEQFLSN